jgi:hypothetical protein
VLKKTEELLFVYLPATRMEKTKGIHIQARAWARARARANRSV